MVLTPDTQVVVDVCKELKAKFSEKSYKGAEIRIQKLFSKHITVEEHTAILKDQKPGKFINVYVGVPNRIKKLIEVGTVNVKGKHFSHLVIDSKLNTKNYSIFDILETRDDAYDLLLLS